MEQLPAHHSNKQTSNKTAHAHKMIIKFYNNQNDAISGMIIKECK